MPPISQKVVADKADVIRLMIERARTLPLQSETAFTNQPNLVAAGESYLRRALEALLDWGRHILAKGFDVRVAEYKEIPRSLRRSGVLSQDLEETMIQMAGYRNRLVHFYDEVTDLELYRILAEQLSDVEAVSDAFRRWMADHPEMVDTSL